jgi:ribonuclease E
VTEIQTEAPYIQRKVPAYPAPETAVPAVMAEIGAIETDAPRLPATSISPAVAEVAVAAPVPEVPVIETASQPEPASFETEKVIEIPPPAAIPARPVAFEPIELPPDLELVETDPAKLRTVASEPVPPSAPRPPRVRPPLPPVNDEPLVQIETGK